MKPNFELLAQLSGDIRVAIAKSLVEFAKKIDPKDYPSDKWVLHAMVTTACMMADRVDYPIAHVLATHLSMQCKDREEAHKILDEKYDNAELGATQRNPGTLLS
jgi:hypothetical protein